MRRDRRRGDAERALVAAGTAVPDWSGGTRLGETLRVFADRWGWWPMQGWLDAFAERGLVRREGAGWVAA